MSESADFAPSTNASDPLAPAEHVQGGSQTGHRHNTTIAAIAANFPLRFVLRSKRLVEARCDISAFYAEDLDWVERNLA